MGDMILRQVSDIRTAAFVLCLLQVRQAYAAAAGEDLGQPAAAAAGDGKRKPVDGAECPICYEELKVRELIKKTKQINTNKIANRRECVKAWCQLSFFRLSLCSDHAHPICYVELKVRER
jgi:hypothetical protein